MFRRAFRLTLPAVCLMAATAFGQMGAPGVPPPPPPSPDNSPAGPAIAPPGANSLPPDTSYPPGQPPPPPQQYPPSQSYPPQPYPPPAQPYPYPAQSSLRRARFLFPSCPRRRCPPTVGAWVWTRSFSNAVRAEAFPWATRPITPHSFKRTAYTATTFNFRCKRVCDCRSAANSTARNQSTQPIGACSSGRAADRSTAIRSKNRSSPIRLGCKSRTWPAEWTISSATRTPAKSKTWNSAGGSA